MSNRNRIIEKIADIINLLWAYVKYIFFVLGGWVSICEIRDLFWPQSATNNTNATIIPKIPNHWLMVTIVIMAVIARIIYERHSLNNCDIKIGNSDIKLSIRRGNLLINDDGGVRKDGTLLIGINDQLKIDQPDEALHTINSQLSKMYPGDNWLIDNFERILRDENTTKLDIGRYIVERHVSQTEAKPDIIFTVMSEYNQAGGATTSVEYINKALDSLFGKDNIGCLNNVLYCPLLGFNCGLGFDYSKEQLIMLIAKCFIVNSKRTASVRHLFIIVRDEDYKGLNIRKLKRMIENMVELSNNRVL